MLDRKTPRFKGALGILLLGAAVLAGLLVPHVAESTPAGGQVHVWELTPESQLRTLAGDCPPGLVCKELCIVYDTGGELGTGRFDCFPP
ncbi:MAG: hypothetical protein KDD47_12205 [Acidobacteria bacterium]|nr:hypothetical protein [Acidobacteriota bacterium]